MSYETHSNVRPYNHTTPTSSPLNPTTSKNNRAQKLKILLNNWREWGEPELKNKIEVDEVELILPVSVATTNVVKDVVKDVVKELTDRQQVILGLIKENPSLSASEMSLKTGMVTRTIQRDLASLHEKGILTREGSRKDVKWVILKISK